MKDFQNYLKLISETEVPTKPGTDIANATNPAEAYMAYKSGLESVWSAMKEFLAKADQQLASLETHAADFRAAAKPLNAIDAHAQSFAPQMARPTVNRDRLAAAVDRFKPGN